MAALTVLLTWEAQDAKTEHACHDVICKVQVLKVGCDQARGCNSDKPILEGHA